MTSDESAKQIASLRARLIALDLGRARLVGQLEALEASSATQAQHEAFEAPPVSMDSSTSAKISLFRRLFRGREDVFPQRWENPKTGKVGYAPACRNEWIRGVCGKPQVKCGECPNQAFIPVGDEVIRSHLTGKALGKSVKFTAGVYPMLPDETCWFLAVDFDKKSWTDDVAAFRETARAKAVPVAIERSRSGNGAHAWIFFAEPVPAAEARRLGAFLVTATMDRCPDIGFDSYDRFFPSQDTMPAGGFGNLIALPLQKGPREGGNSIFVDEDFQPYADQWAYLSLVQRLSRQALTSIVAEGIARGQLLGIRLPQTEDDDAPWAAPPSHRGTAISIQGELPASVEVVLGSRIFIDRTKLPPALVSRIIRLAAFQNPEFYAAQAMRLSTFGKPRVVSCAELFAKHIALPRGCLSELQTLLRDIRIAHEIRDVRQRGQSLGTRFLGELAVEQNEAAAAILAHETGVLAAATAFGKTVVAAKVIAARDRSTLILVHRQQLLDQWVAQLRSFLDIHPEKIGVVHGGKKRPTGFIDVALMQSLVRKGHVSDLVADYGHVVVDECHHLSAVSFEAVLQEAKAQYVLGLSATVTRKDGHHPIIFMQCGPVRHRVDARKQAEARPFEHKVVIRRTAFQLSGSDALQKPKIQEVYSKLAQDPTRNDLIFDDILSALEAGRSPVVITERKDHLDQLAGRLARFAKNVIVFHGGMGTRRLREATGTLTEVPTDEERVIVATGRYLGEGFDDARLDTLFLTMPVSWRGILAQYAGRLHRLYPTKRDVLIYDYVDANEPVLMKMARKREAGYRSLGYRTIEASELGLAATQHKAA